LITARIKCTGITEHSIPRPNQSDSRIGENVDRNLRNILVLVEELEFEKFFELTAVSTNEKSADNAGTDAVSRTLLVTFYSSCLGRPEEQERCCG
jgi:hypothetical protein